MARTADMRAWAAANGHPELAGGKGPLSADVRAEYDAAHQPADDYGAGTSPDDFEEGGLPFVAADEPSPPKGGASGEDDGGGAAEEERPSRPHTSRPRFGWHKPKAHASGKGQRKRKVFKRVSIAPIVEEMYGELAFAAAPIPPLKRLLQAQAPVAGVVLEPVIKDTVADRLVLQPVARNYERMKVGAALLGTPAALMAVLATAPLPVTGPDKQPVMVPVIGPDGQPTGQVTPKMQAPTVQHQVAMLSLRQCVRAMVDVAGDAVDRVRERAAEHEVREDRVDDFIAFLLDIQVVRGAEESEAQKARDAGLKLAGATIGE